MSGKPIDDAVLDRACEAYAEISGDYMGFVRRRAMREALAAAQQGQAVAWADEWRAAVAAKLSSYGLSEEAAAVFASSELDEYKAGLCDCAENDPVDMVDLMMGVARDAIEKWKIESAGRPFGHKNTAPPPSAPVGVEGLLADLETIWHSVSDDKETNAAYERLKIAVAQQPAAPSGEAGAFDANFLQSVASLCRAAYDLCQPKPQRTPEDPREHYGELCLLELTSIADEIERRLAAAEGVQPEESRSVAHQLLHWGGIAVRVTGTVTTSPGNWPLIDATQHQEPKS